MWCGKREMFEKCPILSTVSSKDFVSLACTKKYLVYRYTVFNARWSIDRVYLVYIFFAGRGHQKIINRNYDADKRYWRKRPIRRK